MMNQLILFYKPNKKVKKLKNDELSYLKKQAAHKRSNMAVPLASAFLHLFVLYQVANRSMNRVIHVHIQTSPLLPRIRACVCVEPYIDRLF